jgi:hypothetical protein
MRDNLTIKIGQTWQKTHEGTLIQIRILDIYVFMPGYKDEAVVFYEYEDIRNGITEKHCHIGIHEWFKVDDSWQLLES